MPRASRLRKFAAISQASRPPIRADARRMKHLGPVDLLVIGGGINGAGIARDAAGRGLSVILCEKGDLAEGTSSRSGKYIHGGLRYLEYFEFRLVREALTEREVLLNAAPHIVWPMRIVLPHSPDQRPAWLVRLGLFLYDHLGKRQELPGCRRIDLHRDPEGQAIKPEFKIAFEYSDCWVDDSRLVVLNALDAAERGATILTRTAATSARRSGDTWSVDMRKADGTEVRAQARVLVNAAGPWVEDVLGRIAGMNSRRRVRLVKGSHIVVPKFWSGPQAYLFQNHDKRVIFVNPYEDDLCLIGTTDVPYDGRADDVAIDSREIDYLIAAVNRYTRHQLRREDVRHAFSGVRPLYDDQAKNPSAVTRDYVFDIDGGEGRAPLLSIFGGKITTYRRLAEHALDRLSTSFPSMQGAWTAHAVLPGGDIPDRNVEGFAERLTSARRWLSREVALHYSRLYGTRALKVLGNAASMLGLGRHFGGSLYQREVEYVCESEWAMTADDVLDRRTKHGLHLSPKERAEVESFVRSLNGRGGHSAAKSSK
jgi:D-erythritol 1-phosphate dehydrogenase